MADTLARSLAHVPLSCINDAVADAQLSVTLILAVADAATVSHAATGQDRLTVVRHVAACSEEQREEQCYEG